MPNSQLSSDGQTIFSFDAIAQLKGNELPNGTSLSEDEINPKPEWNLKFVLNVNGCSFKWTIFTLPQMSYSSGPSSQSSSHVLILKFKNIQLKWTRICTRDGLYLSSYHLTIEIFTFLCSVWSHFSISNLIKFHMNTYHTNSSKNEKTYRSRQCYNGLTHLEMFFCLTFTANCIYFAQKSFSRTWTMHIQPCPRTMKFWYYSFSSVCKTISSNERQRMKCHIRNRCGKSLAMLRIKIIRQIKSNQKVTWLQFSY